VAQVIVDVAGRERHGQLRTGVRSAVGVTEPLEPALRASHVAAGPEAGEVGGELGQPGRGAAAPPSREARHRPGAAGEGWLGNDTNEMTSPVTAQVRALDAINPADLGLRDAITGGVLSVKRQPGSGKPIGGQRVALHEMGHVSVFHREAAMNNHSGG
jgi:hypothetical protein